MCFPLKFAATDVLISPYRTNDELELLLSIEHGQLFRAITSGQV